MFSFLRRLFSQSVAMDLGTANTLLYTPKGGIIINEPSVVAVDALTGRPLAVGEEARRYLGRTPRNMRTVRPLKEGVIADFDVTQAMISHFIRKALHLSRLARPDMAICIPSGITQVEKRAVIDAAHMAGAHDVRLIEEPMAAALGAGLPVHDAVGSMVLDIGGGTSETAVISLSATAVTQSVRLAGDALNEAVQRYLRDQFHLEVGILTAESLKWSLGSALPLEEELEGDVMGKDVVLGMPRTIRISSGHIREAISEVLEAMAGTVTRSLERTPPELAADIYGQGMLISGGGALLSGLAQFLSEKAGISVRVDDDPLTTVLRGTAAAMEERDPERSLFIN